MRYYLSTAGKTFFKNHGAISFDGFISEETREELLDFLEEHHEEPYDSICNHDLFRNLPFLKKAFNKANVHRLAGELFGEKMLRYGYDQVLFGSDPELSEDFRMSDKSSLQGLVGGFLLCLKASEGEELIVKTQHQRTPGEEEEAKIYEEPLLQEPGALTFFKEAREITLAKNPGSVYLLVTYASLESVFVQNSKDPYSSFYRDLGYIFGDALNNEHHPIVLK